MVASSLKKNVNTYLNLKDLKYPYIVEKDNRTQELAKLYKEKEKKLIKRLLIYMRIRYLLIFR